MLSRWPSSVYLASGTNGHKGLGTSLGRGGATETGDVITHTNIISIKTSSVALMLQLD